MKKTWSEFLHSLSHGLAYLQSAKLEKYTILISLIFILSILDAFFTLVWIDTGLAVEANPLLKELLLHGNFSFISTKLFLTGIGCVLLFLVKAKNKIAKFSIWFIFLCYCILIAYHFIGLFYSLDQTELPVFLENLLD